MSVPTVHGERIWKDEYQRLSREKEGRTLVAAKGVEKWAAFSIQNPEKHRNGKNWAGGSRIKLIPPVLHPHPVPKQFVDLSSPPRLWGEQRWNSIWSKRIEGVCVWKSEISISFLLLRPRTPTPRIKFQERRLEGATPEKILVNSDICRASVKTTTGPPICLSEDHQCIRPTHVCWASGQVSFLVPYF